MFFYPEKADDGVGRGAGGRGRQTRPRRWARWTSWCGASLAIGDDVEDRLAWAKPQLALYIGGMGAKGRNFYHNLATRYGFGEVADRIQELYLSGARRRGDRRGARRIGARHVSLIGPRGFVTERLAAFAEAGVTTLLVQPADRGPQRVRALRRGAAGAAALISVEIAPRVVRTRRAQPSVQSWGYGPA